jgi:hypothetical protein
MGRKRPDYSSSVWEEEGDALLAEVKERLSAGSEALLPREIKDSRLMTEIIFSLELDFNAHIEGIYTDMWSGISATSYDESFRVWIQCDSIEHGFAGVWKAFADRESIEETIKEEKLSEAKKILAEDVEQFGPIPDEVVEDVKKKWPATD